MRKTKISIPELQIVEDNNKENIPTLSPMSTTNKQQKSKVRKKSLFEPVAPLQLLTEENREPTVEEEVEEEEVEEVEEVEECGDIITNITIPTNESITTNLDENISTNNNLPPTIEAPPKMIPIIKSIPTPPIVPIIKNPTPEMINIISNNSTPDMPPIVISNPIITNPIINNPIINPILNNHPTLVNNNLNNRSVSNINNDTNTTNTNSNSNSLSPSSYTLSANGQLMESAVDWVKRPKVTLTGSEMTFRPLRMKCTHCEEAYTKTHDLYAHIRSHQHHTKCPHCGKILTCMATFVYHVRTHTTEKPYYCPVDGCDFNNAVKYNLKVHLACIRHGGKDNLKKYAKVLDLDVCEKSLKKRKDNSVHELGSRRCKKRRKLNNGSSNYNMHDLNESSSGMPSMSNFYPKQEEYAFDQVAASLLYHFPLVFDPNQTNAQQSIVDWNSIMPSNQTHASYKLENYDNTSYKLENGVKSEKQSTENMTNVNANMNARLKLEQYYDPSMYGYYGYNAANMANVQSLTAQSSMSASASTIWDQHKLDSQMGSTQATSHSITPQNKAIEAENENSKENSNSAIVPKQEPIYSDYLSSLPSYTHAHIPSYDPTMSASMIPPQNMYYPNYYMNTMPNYDNSNSMNMNMNSMNHMYTTNTNANDTGKKLEIPPLPELFPDTDTSPNASK